MEGSTVDHAERLYRNVVELDLNTRRLSDHLGIPPRCLDIATC
jgi:hypothetical protein